jgi:hypothetical protein
MTAKLKVYFRLPSRLVYEVVGREAETIIALVDAGPRGITSLEAFRAGWAVRLSAYVFDLRAMGVPIRSTREQHEGGSHARYTLEGQVEIVWRSDDGGLAVAA